MRISEEKITEIREKNDIVDIVGQYVKLEKRGRNYVGLCPFHDEKTPSFTVSPEKQICKCFACKKGGNVIHFIEQIENISFIEALKKLGENVGIEVESSVPKVNIANDQLKMIEMHELLRDYYHYVLTAVEEATPALEYLYERGFTDQMIQDEKIGLSLNMNTFARDYLEKHGFDKVLAYEAGLLSRNEENFSYYDRFRNRIMFPINNAQGRTVGFSGRTFNNEEPKYLNSPESPIFQKRYLLYHLDVARRHIRKLDEVILLEGFMDVIKVTNVGMTNTIATMGTALSREHKIQLKKLASNVTLMFDGDRAGLDATMKIGKELLEEGINVYVVPMKDDMDPDEMLRSLGEDPFLQFVQLNKVAFLSYKLRQMTKEVLNNDLVYEQRLAEVIKDASLIQSDMIRKKVLHEASELFKVDFDSLQFEVNKKLPTVHQPMLQKTSEKYSKQEIAERIVLKHFFNHKHTFLQVYEVIAESHFKKESHQHIFHELKGYYNKVDHFNLSGFLTYLPHQYQNDAISIEQIEINEEVDRDEINDYIYTIKDEPLEKNELNELKMQLNEAVQQGDNELRDRIMSRIVELHRNKKNK